MNDEFLGISESGLKSGYRRIAQIQFLLWAQCRYGAEYAKTYVYLCMAQFKIILTVLILTYILSACDTTSGCSNTIMNRINSLDSQSKILIFGRDCGATTANSIQISVLKAKDSLPNDGGNIFISNARGNVEASWVNEKIIRIKYNRNLEIYKKDSLVSGFEIVYQIQ
jgi:hypothetical protein